MVTTESVDKIAGRLNRAFLDGDESRVRAELSSAPPIVAAAAVLTAANAIDNRHGRARYWDFRDLVSGLASDQIRNGYPAAQGEA